MMPLRGACVPDGKAYHRPAMLFLQMKTIKPFKKRIFQVIKPYPPQPFIMHLRLFITLQHHSRQLFMITNQDKLPIPLRPSLNRAQRIPNN